MLDIDFLRHPEVLYFAKVLMMHMVLLAYTLAKNMINKGLHFLQSQASGGRISSQKLSMVKGETTGPFGQIQKFNIVKTLEVLE